MQWSWANLLKIICIQRTKQIMSPHLSQEGWGGTSGHLPESIWCFPAIMDYSVPPSMPSNPLLHPSIPLPPFIFPLFLLPPAWCQLQIRRQIPSPSFSSCWMVSLCLVAPTPMQILLHWAPPTVKLALLKLLNTAMQKLHYFASMHLPRTESLSQWHYTSYSDTNQSCM